MNLKAISSELSVSLRTLSILSLLLFCVNAFAQTGYYTRQYHDKALNREAKRWVKNGEWRNGFTKASPDKTVNITDFYLQYNNHPELWKALFAWLQETDLTAIPSGKMPIPGTPLVASVEDSHNDPLEKRKTESHYRNIDFMYVVKGTEGFCRLDHLTSKVSVPYNEKDVIRYDYVKDKLQYFESNDGHFNIFFPDDWHIAKVQTTQPDQTIRVIVVKMPYADVSSSTRQ